MLWSNQILVFLCLLQADWAAVSRLHASLVQQQPSSFAVRFWAVAQITGGLNNKAPTPGWKEEKGINWLVDLSLLVDDVAFHESSCLALWMNAQQTGISEIELKSHLFVPPPPSISAQLLFLEVPLICVQLATWQDWTPKKLDQLALLALIWS